MRDIESFLAHFRRQHAWTFQLVAAIPEDRFDWAPSPADFSLGGIVRHLIQSEVFWVRLLVKSTQGERYDPFSATLPGDPGQERVKAFRAANVQASQQDRLGSSFAQCLESWQGISQRTESELRALGPESFGVEVEHPLTGIRAPLWEMLLIMLEHEAHHRGQLSACLKVLGIPQPPVMATP